MNHRRVWSIVIAMWVLGLLAGIVCWRDAEAQQIEIDTSTMQYHDHQMLVDSLAAGSLQFWVGRLHLHDWHIVLRADTLEQAVARAFVHEQYREAVVVIDTRNRLTWNSHQVLLHELLHVKLASYTALARLFAGGHDILLYELQRHEEALVTDLAKTYSSQP